MMKIGYDCLKCIINNQFRQADKAVDEEKKILFIKNVARLIAEMDEDLTVVELSADCSAIQKQILKTNNDYSSQKTESNYWGKKYEGILRNQIKSASNPFEMALRYAITGNYLDYAVIKNISEEQLQSLIKDLNIDMILKTNTYKQFVRDLSNAKELVYITDNCGEIVFDKLLIENLMELYGVHVNVIVRGSNVLNDATYEDASFVGLDQIATIISNGTGFAGTVMSKISKEAKRVIENADLIFAKGQGNYESLSGSGMNIYYTFLCKCDLFMRRFNVERNSPVFVHESNHGNYNLWDK